MYTYNNMVFLECKVHITTRFNGEAHFRTLGQWWHFETTSELNKIWQGLVLGQVEQDGTMDKNN